MPISHFVKKIFLPSGDHGQILAPNSTDYYLDSALARNMWGGHFCPPPLTLPWLLPLLLPLLLSLLCFSLSGRSASSAAIKDYLAGL
jgi:hypothetical protein